MNVHENLNKKSIFFLNLDIKPDYLKQNKKATSLHLDQYKIDLNFNYKYPFDNVRDKLHLDLTLVLT